MSESNGADNIVIYDGWNNIILPRKRVEHLESWVENTFDRLCKHSRRQKNRQKRLDADLNALMQTFDELKEAYLE